MLFWGSCSYQRLDRSNHTFYRLQRAQLQDQEAGVLSQINAIRTLTSYVFVNPSTVGPLQCFSSRFSDWCGLRVCLFTWSSSSQYVCLCTWSSSSQYVCLCTWSSGAQYVCARGLHALNMFVYARGLHALSMFAFTVTNSEFSRNSCKVRIFF
jgi:hypothetical protein